MSEVARIGIIQELAAKHGIELPLSGAFTLPEVVGEDYKGEIIPHLDEKTYHTDLSAVARGDVVAALASPAHVVARRQRPYEEQSTNDALRIGRLVHAMLLEPAKFKDSFVVMPDFGAMQSSKNRATRDAWIAELPSGAQILKPDELPMLFGMARGLSKNQMAMDIFEGAIFEASVFYRDPVTGLKCRTRPDIINRGLGVLADLKTTRSADFAEFQRATWANRYDIQLSMYAESVHRVTGEMPTSYPIIAIEKEPPYSCVVFNLDYGMKIRGAADYRRGLDSIYKCITSNKWDGYPQSMDLSAPRYAALSG